MGPVWAAAPASSVNETLEGRHSPVKARPLSAAAARPRSRRARSAIQRPIAAAATAITQTDAEAAAHAIASNPAARAVKRTPRARNRGRAGRMPER